MTRISTSIVVAVALLASILLGSSPSRGEPVEPASDPAAAPPPEHTLFIGTGPVVGVYFPAGGAICDLVNRRRQQNGIRCAVESSGGSVENLAALRDGRMDLVIAQSDWQHRAYEGTGPFEEDGPFEDLRSVFAIHADSITVVAGPKSEIETLSDLKGKRVNIGPPGSGQRAMAEALIGALGWALDDFAEVSEEDPNEQPEALCAGTLDALVFPASHPNGLIHQAIQGCGATLIDVSGPEIDQLVAETPYFTKSVIPGGTYAGNDEDVQTFGVRATLVTTARQDEEIVYRLVAAVFDDLERFKALHPAFATLTPEEMIGSGNSAPLHPGALRYYEERGWR
jgi:hypothetical protein